MSTLINESIIYSIHFLLIWFETIVIGVEMAIYLERNVFQANRSERIWYDFRVEKFHLIETIQNMRKNAVVIVAISGREDFTNEFPRLLK